MSNRPAITGGESAAELQAKIDGGDSYTVDAKAIVRFVTRYIDGDLLEPELEQIGDLLEGAEFFEYVGPGSDGLLAQVVYEISTPEAKGPITRDAAARWLQLLGD
jgi:hypothetical protein